MQTIENFIKAIIPLMRQVIDHKIRDIQDEYLLFMDKMQTGDDFKEQVAMLNKFDKNCYLLVRNFLVGDDSWRECVIDVYVLMKR